MSDDPPPAPTPTPTPAPTTVRAEPADAGSRLDRFLAARLPQLSRARIQALVRSGHIRLNGAGAKPSQLLAAGDEIAVEVPVAAAPAEAVPQAIPLSVLYEDAQIIVVDKPHGLVVHPAAGNPDGTLVNALLHHCKGSLSGVGGVERPGIVHRLDKDTSGCLVAAKTDAAHRALVEAFSGRRVDKTYLAVVDGRPREASGRIVTHIDRHPADRQKMANVDPPRGREAITDYRVRGGRADANLVECRLHTGRTHQIRVHLKSLGTPILGDPIYAKPARQRHPSTRLMLHAWKLGFAHPTTGEPLAFEAPAPPEFGPWLADG